MISGINARLPCPNMPVRSGASRFFLLACIVAAVAYLIFLIHLQPKIYTISYSKFNTGNEPYHCYPTLARITPTPVQEEMWDKTALKEEIETKQWRYKHLQRIINPKTPDSLNCINATVVDQMKRELNFTTQAFITKILDHTLVVSHNDFEALLSHASSKLIAALKTRNYVIVFNEPKKSERWIGELALKYLKHLPVDFVDIQGLHKSLSFHPEVRDVVIFDDAAYSCNQITTTIANIFIYNPVHIHVVIPFISDVGCFEEILKRKRDLYEPMYKLPSSTDYSIYHAVEFGTKLDVTKFILPNETDLAESLKVKPWLSRADSKSYLGKHMLILNHKVADDISIPRDFYFLNLTEGRYNFIQDPTPPYRIDEVD